MFFVFKIAQILNYTDVKLTWFCAILFFATKNFGGSKEQRWNDKDGLVCHPFKQLLDVTVVALMRLCVCVNQTDDKEVGVRTRAH